MDVLKGQITKEYKKIASTRMEGKKSWKPRNRRTAYFEEDVKMMGIRNWQAVARGWKEWGRILFEAKRSVALDDDDDEEEEEEEKVIIIIIIIIISCTPIVYLVACSHL